MLSSFWGSRSAMMALVRRSMNRDSRSLRCWARSRPCQVCTSPSASSCFRKPACRRAVELPTPLCPINACLQRCARRQCCLTMAQNHQHDVGTDKLSPPLSTMCRPFSTCACLHHPAPACSIFDPTSDLHTSYLAQMVVGGIAALPQLHRFNIVLFKLPKIGHAVRHRPAQQGPELLEIVLHTSDSATASVHALMASHCTVMHCL